jgi:hypothetical protein
VTGVDLTGGGAAANVNFGFSFNVVTNTRGGDATDDDAFAGRTVQGSLRQFIQNANAITGERDALRARRAPNVITGVYNDDANYTNDGGDDWWRISVSVALPQITGVSTTIDGAAYSRFDGVSAANTNTGSLGTGTVGTGPDGVTGTGDEPSGGLRGRNTRSTMR